MKDGLYLTEKWTLDEILPHGAEITRYMKKLIDKFPQDATLNSMTQDIMAGGLSLWLMFHDERLIGIVITELRTVPATGYKTCLISGLSGEGDLDLCEHIETIEQYAWERECDAVIAVGRKGWEKVIGKMGYKVERTTFGKTRP